jgi:hypothetical protein
MANKSYTQSEIGQEEAPVDDPEQAKDFNSAYQKVKCRALIYIINMSIVSGENIFRIRFNHDDI